MNAVLDYSLFLRLCYTRDKQSRGSVKRAFIGIVSMTDATQSAIRCLDKPCFYGIFMSILLGSSPLLPSACSDTSLTDDRAGRLSKASSHLE